MYSKIIKINVWYFYDAIITTIYFSYIIAIIQFSDLSDGKQTFINYQFVLHVSRLNAKKK